MKIQKIVLIAGLMCTPLAWADATDDLLYAIEKGDIEKAEQAFSQGADCDVIRGEHNARSLAIAKILESAETQNSLLATGAASLMIPAVALYQKPMYALAGLTSMVAS